MLFIKRETIALTLVTGVLANGCKARESAPPKVTHVYISPAADSDIVRSIGVPSEPDDTMGAADARHETPRPIAAPACLPAGIALCLDDQTRTRVGGVSGAAARETQWIVFAAANDSMQLFAANPRASISMTPHSAAGFSAETSGQVDAPWIRPRFPHAGTYVIIASIPSSASDSTVPDQLRIIPVVARGASRPIGVSATLQLAGDSSVRIVIAPASMVESIPAPRLEPFAVRPGTYQVLLVRDTTYVTCRLPCASRGTVVLHAGQHVALRD